MRLLLDTHVWLWSLREPDRLSVRVRRHLEDPANEIWLSPISVWEALLLHAKGRISIAENVADWLKETTAQMHEAPLTSQIALAAHQLRFPHRDPADRFLVATACVLDLTLVTADVHLLGLPEIRSMANR